MLNVQSDFSSGHHIRGPESPSGLPAHKSLCALHKRKSWKHGQQLTSHVVFEGVLFTVPYKIWVASTTPLTEEHKQEIAAEIDAAFLQVDLTLNNYNPTSELAAINHHMADSLLPVSPEMASFLQNTVQRCHRLSGGLYDPTIGPLLQHWMLRLSQGEEPTDAEIERLMRRVGLDKLQLEAVGSGAAQAHAPVAAHAFVSAHGNGAADTGPHQMVLRKLVSGVQLDLGGTAKGYAVDLVVSRLEALGLADVYVDWGGDIRAIGSHSTRHWTAALLPPRTIPLDATASARVEGAAPALRAMQGAESVAGGQRDEVNFFGHLAIDNVAVATSGDYEKCWVVKDAQGKNKLYSHILYPKTGCCLQPKAGRPASVSIMARECAVADGLATAAMAHDDVGSCRAWLDECIKNSDGLVMGYCILSRGGNAVTSPTFQKYLKVGGGSDEHCTCTDPSTEAKVAA